MHNLFHPYSRAVRKYLYEMIPDYYSKDIDEISERMASMIATEKDVERFGKLIGAIYTAGYIKAMNDTKQKLQENGIRLKISSPKSPN